MLDGGARKRGLWDGTRSRSDEDRGGWETNKLEKLCLDSVWFVGAFWSIFCSVFLSRVWVVDIFFGGGKVSTRFEVRSDIGKKRWQKLMAHNSRNIYGGEEGLPVWCIAYDFAKSDRRESIPANWVQAIFLRKEMESVARAKRKCFPFFGTRKVSPICLSFASIMEA